jgi:hypothetical protein
VKKTELICNRLIGFKLLQIIRSSLLFIIDNNAEYKHCMVAELVNCIKMKVADIDFTITTDFYFYK